jgi:hypothetical protein
MDKTTLAFIGLLAVLFIGQVFINENFYNFAGTTDVSGNITLSLSDLMTLIGYGSSTTAPTRSITDTTLTHGSYNKMRDELRSDVKQAVRDEMLAKEFSDETVLDDSCIDSFSAQQGSDFMKYIPGKNPDDYIRKDSVPCYGCSIPT